MKKASLVLFTAAFVTGCFGLWFLLAISQGIYSYHFHGHSLPACTKLVLENRTILLVIPVPFVLLSAYALRKPINSEVIALIVGILAFVFIMLIFGVAASALFPFVPYME